MEAEGRDSKNSFINTGFLGNEAEIQSAINEKTKKVGDLRKN
jgi:hypothetical protein